MDNLNQDNLIDILSELDYDSLSQMCTTNKEFKDACSNERIWETLTQRKFGSTIKQLDSWYNTYRSLIRPIYTLTIYGDPDHEKPATTELFYSLEPAIDALIHNKDIMSNLRYELDFQKYGYSDLFIDFVCYYGFDGMKDVIENWDANPHFQECTSSELAALVPEIDRFNEEFDSIVREFFTSHLTHTFEMRDDHLSYAITKTTVHP